MNDLNDESDQIDNNIEAGIDPYGEGGQEISLSTSDNQLIGEIASEIYQLIEQAPAKLLNSNKITIDKDIIIPKLDQLKNAIPDQLARSEQIFEKANETIANARVSADEIIKDAQEKVNELVAKEQVYLIAQDWANETRDSAKLTAKKIKADADVYCDKRLKEFSETLEILLAQTNAGRSKLYQSIQEAKESGILPDDRHE